MSLSTVKLRKWAKRFLSAREGAGLRRASLAALALVYTVGVVIVSVVEGLSSASLPRSNIRYSEGRYQVHIIAAGDILDCAGVRSGDEITACNGQVFANSLELWSRFAVITPGDPVSFTVRRGGETLELAARTWPLVRLSDALRVLFPVIVLLVLGTGVFVARPQQATFLLLLFCLISAINDVVQITVIAGQDWPQRLLTFAYTMTSLPSSAILLHFFLVFPSRGPVQHYLRLFLPFSYALQLVLGLDYYLATVIPAAAGFLSRPEVCTPLISLFSASVGACYGLSLVSLAAVLWRVADARVRNQAKILASGLFLLFLLHAALVDLPIRFLDRTLIGSNSLCLLDLIIPACVALAVLGQRMFDINLLIRHGLIYGSASAAVAAAFITLMALFGWASEQLWDRTGGVLLAIVAAVVAMLFNPARQAAQRLVDRLFYRRRYDYGQMLTETSARLSRIIGLPAALEFLSTRINQALSPAWIEFAIRREDGSTFDLHDSHGQPLPGPPDGLTGKVLEIADEQQIPFAPSTEQGTGNRAIAFVVPLVWGRDPLGAVLLGPRPAEVPYLPEDKEFLAALASLTATVIDNSRLIEERATRERLALLGTAASSIIHELKNPLGAMHSTLAVLRRRLRDDAQGTELTHIVEGEVERLKDRVMNVLSFVRPEPTRHTSVAVEELLRQLIPVVEAEFETLDVSIGFHIEPASAAVEGDSDRLRQAFLNLLFNAREAMPSGGRVEVTLGPWLDKDAAVRGVEVAVTDTGPGFPAATLDRVFEPFYTTKALGTGLGLANVKRIVDEHRGTVEAGNSPAGGAVVRVYLPVRGRISSGIE